MATPTLYRNLRRTLPRLKTAVELHDRTIYDYLYSANLLDKVTYDDALVCGVTLSDPHQILVFPKEYTRDVLSIGAEKLQLIKHMKKTTDSQWGAVDKANQQHLGRQGMGITTPYRYFNWSDSYPLSHWLNLKVSGTLPGDKTTFIELDVVIQSLREEYHSQHP